MKYLVPNFKVKEIEDAGYTILIGVDVQRKGLAVIPYGYSSGWIFDADETFDLYYSLKFGWQPIKITDEEFVRLTTDSILFPEKSRARYLYNAYHDLVNEHFGISNL